MFRMRPFSLILLILAPAVSAQAAGGGGSISGTILPPGKARSIQAFERERATLFEIVNRYHKGTIDPETGRFEIPDLPDGTYQLLIDCGDTKIEGVDLHIDDEEAGPVFDYVFKTKALTSNRLDLSEFFEPDEEVPDERKSQVIGRLIGVPKLLEKLDSLRQVERFCDHLRPLYAHGTKDKAFVLVETARLRDFYAGRGQAIYRVEVWQFHRVGTTWDHPTKGVRVLQRHRFENKADLKAFGVFFEPKLGGIRILRARSVADIQYTIPEAWDDALGKVPGQDMTLR